jgi:hypothetical protein
VNTVAVLLALLLQAAPAAPPAALAPALRQLREHLEERRAVFGAAPELTAAKHQLRDWVESRLAGTDQNADAAAFALSLHTALAGAHLLCNDLNEECDWNFLGYVDDVRVSRSNGFLVIVTAIGIYCGFDESAYVYRWDGQRWRRVWEHERTTYTTTKDYLPQSLHDVQISAADGGGGRLIMTLGSQTVCGGAFKDLYARVWRLDSGDTIAPLLDWTAHANDAYPPIQGRVLADDVLLAFTAGGQLSGEVHTAVRHFKVERGVATPADPVASLPRDFVVEWLTSPWSESRTRSESPSLEAAHAQLYRNDGVGDLPESTFKCSGGPDLWQVATHLYEGPKRFYRVRWRDSLVFSMVAISEQPYADCTIADARGETYPDLFGRSAR